VNSALGQVCIHGRALADTRRHGAYYRHGQIGEFELGNLSGSHKLSVSYASWPEPSPVTRARELLDPGPYVGLSVSDQIASLDVLRSVSNQPPSTEASQVNLEAR
jgi:hypothetical protein